MSRIKPILLSLLAVCAMGAVASASALAASTNNPQWGMSIAAGGECQKVVAGTGEFNSSACTATGAPHEWETLLGAGKVLEVVAEQNGEQKLVGVGITIKCNKLKVKPGSTIIGSVAPAPGTSEETLEYSECSVEGKPNCKINGENGGAAKLTTNLLKDTLVFKTKVAAEKEESDTLTLFEPKVGAVFISFKLTGECGGLPENISVEGKTLLENVNGSTHLATHELNGPATAITKYFKNNAGVTEEVKNVKLSVLALAATYVGKSNVKLASGASWWIFN
jgi:hypothetical protein